MNKEKMLEAIGDIDPEFIREAKPSSRKGYLRYASAIAAAAVLVVGIAFVLPHIKSSAPDPGSGPSVTAGQAAGADPTVVPNDPQITGSVPVLGADPTVAPGDYHYSGGGAGISASMREELRSLVARSDLIALASCEWDGETPVYTLIEAIKGELPDRFTVKDGAASLETAEHLLFLTENADGEYGMIAALIRSESSQSATNMSADFAEADFIVVVSTVSALASNE